MGQYHNLMCIETRSSVSPYPLGAGSKAAEQVWTPMALSSALALLCACNKGQHERDIPWAPHGAWAGKTPMNFGDYADDGDIYGCDLPTPEGQIRDLLTDKPRPLSHRNSSSKTFSDLSMAILPVLERVHKHRCFGLDVNGNKVSRVGWANMIPVRKDRKDPDQWCLDLSETPTDDHKDVLDYYERVGVTKNDCWRRPPLNMALCGKSVGKLPPAPDEIADPSHGQGEPLLWVNLDRGEFIDPAVIGDEPDLAGIITGWSGSAVLAMLYHHTPRGGGDIGHEGPLSISGRWRGDRIALIGAEGIKVAGLPKVTQSIARGEFTDISNNALCFVLPEKVFGAGSVYSDGGISTALEAAGPGARDLLLKLLQVALGSKVVADLCASKGKEIISQMRAVFVPPQRVSLDVNGKLMKSPLRLAPRFELLLDDGKLRLDQATHLEIAKLMNEASVEDLSITKVEDQDAGKVSLDAIQVLTTAGMSNHVLINILPDVAA